MNRCEASAGVKSVDHLLQNLTSCDCVELKKNPHDDVLLRSLATPVPHIAAVHRADPDVDRELLSPRMTGLDAAAGGGPVATAVGAHPHPYDETMESLERFNGVELPHLVRNRAWFLRQTFRSHDPHPARQPPEHTRGRQALQHRRSARRRHPGDVQVPERGGHRRCLWTKSSASRPSSPANAPTRSWGTAAVLVSVNNRVTEFLQCWNYAPGNNFVIAKTRYDQYEREQFPRFFCLPLESNKNYDQGNVTYP